MDYCRYSAAPVGRFVLDVHGESARPVAGQRRALRRAAGDQPPAGLRQGLPRARPRLHPARCAGGRRAPTSTPWRRRTPSPALRGVIAALAQPHRTACSTSRGRFAGQIADRRLALEVGVIQRWRRDLTARPDAPRSAVASASIIGQCEAARPVLLRRRASAGRASAGSPDRAAPMTLRPKPPSALQAQVSRQLLLRRHARACRRPSARRCSPSTRFCRLVDDIADDGTRPRRERAVELDAWRADLDALYAGSAGRTCRLPRAARARLRPAAGRFPGRDRRHGHGRRRGHPRARPRHARSLLRPRGQRRRPAVDHASSAWTKSPASSWRIDLGRALQLTNILRDLDEDAAIGRLYLPRELLTQAGIATTDPQRGDRRSARRRRLPRPGRSARSSISPRPTG